LLAIATTTTFTSARGSVAFCAMSALAGENASMAIADHLPPLLPSLANAWGDAVGYAACAAAAHAESKFSSRRRTSMDMDMSCKNFVILFPFVNFFYETRIPFVSSHA